MGMYNGTPKEYKQGKKYEHKNVQIECELWKKNIVISIKYLPQKNIVFHSIITLTLFSSLCFDFVGDSDNFVFFLSLFTLMMLAKTLLVLLLVFAFASALKCSDCQYVLGKNI